MIFKIRLYNVGYNANLPKITNIVVSYEVNAAILMIFPFLPRAVLHVGTCALLPRPALKKNDGGMTKQIFVPSQSDLFLFLQCDK